MTDSDKYRLEIYPKILDKFEGKTLLDIGAGEGLFADIAKQKGWRVTAMDARDERVKYTEGIKWIKSDIREFDVGDYDAISILGLLYHLDRPFELLKRCSYAPTIIDTHFSFKETSEIDGYKGSFFKEKLEFPTASWGNVISFWPTEKELIRMMKDAGYKYVYPLKHYRENRAFYICLPVDYNPFFSNTGLT